MSLPSDSDRILGRAANTDANAVLIFRGGHEMPVKGERSELKKLVGDGWEWIDVLAVHFSVEGDRQVVVPMSFRTDDIVGVGEVTDELRELRAAEARAVRAMQGGMAL